MGKSLTQKLIEAHLVSGSTEPGAEVALRIDQTLTQDATGTMAYLEFESMGIDRVRTKRSVAYVDHNTLQSGFENADDHRYIQTVAAKHILVIKSQVFSYLAGRQITDIRQRHPGVAGNEQRGKGACKGVPEDYQLPVRFCMGIFHG